MNVFRKVWFITLVLAFGLGCSQPTTQQNPSSPPAKDNSGTPDAKATALDMSGAKTMDGGLKYKDIDQPTADNARPSKTLESGDLAEVEYQGMLSNGKVFDQNFPTPDNSVAKPPFTFTVGGGGVIPGWDKGVVGMHVGQTRYLDIPSELGYGPAGQGTTIPPNSELLFKVKLLGVVKAGQEMVFDTKDEKVGTGPAAGKNDVVSISYDGKLLNGTEFEKIDKDSPLRFQLDTGKVNATSHIGVSGLQYAIEGMKVGGVRLITLPPQAGYTSGQAPAAVPPDNIIQFEVTLLKIEPASALK